MRTEKAQTLVAYWLIPATPVRDFLVSIIAKLATQYGAPAFEPHVTIYAGTNENGVPRKILWQTLSGLENIRLSIRGVEWSGEFAKTVFVQFAPSKTLSAMSDAVREALANGHDYQLNPHLSLIYKTMPSSSKEELAASIALPFSEVVFDSVQAIACPVRAESRADIESWRVIGTQPLKSSQ